MSDPNFAPKWADTLPARCPPCTQGWRCNQGRCQASEPATDSEINSWTEGSAAIETPRGGLRFMALLILVALAIVAGAVGARMLW